MPAHLRPLPTCATCGAPATQTLYNTLNSPLGSYCNKHAGDALRAHQRAHEGQAEPYSE